MITREILLARFLEAYHSTPLHDMAYNINMFLLSDPFIEYKENEHFLYLFKQMIRIQRDYNHAGAPDELPGMCYGMFYEAFTCLLNDMFPRQ